VFWCSNTYRAMAAELQQQILDLLAQEPQTEAIRRQVTFLEKRLAKLDAVNEGKFPNTLISRVV
jgi:hypothetical protein